MYDTNDFIMCVLYYLCYYYIYGSGQEEERGGGAGAGAGADDGREGVDLPLAETLVKKRK